MSGEGRAAAHLELVFCSSEDERFPATNVTRPGGGQLAVWESEKFCDFPQELVFRVNHGLPTRIEQVNLLSHPFKVATRVEIFTSSASASSDGIHDGKTGMRFDRLGFVCFLSDESTDVAACELQEVQLPRPCSKLTHLRLVLDSCHQTRSNLFSQVGLASVEALGPQQMASVVLPMIPSPRKNPTMDAPSPRRRAYSAYDTNASKPVRTYEAKSPRAADVYMKDTQEQKTPEQIMADIQIGKQLAQFAGDDTLVLPWISFEREANRLINSFEQAATPNRLRIQSDTKNYTTEGLCESFGDLERRRKQQEILLYQRVSTSPRSTKDGQDLSAVLLKSKENDILKRFKASQPQEKEALLWTLAEASETSTGRSNRRTPLTHHHAMSDEKTVLILIAALDDTNTEVFVAGCAFLRSLLASLPYFQDTSASKLDITEIVDCLLERLDSREASVRNSAAFALLKIAGSTRTRGTFVTHLLLKHVEHKSSQPSDQQLLALLKLLSALLLSFHCCANFDIAPRRILRFLTLSDAGQHENALIREAAKQLVLALCNDVDEEFVLNHEHQRRYDFPLRQKNSGTLSRPSENNTSSYY